MRWVGVSALWESAARRGEGGQELLALGLAVGVGVGVGVGLGLVRAGRSPGLVDGTADRRCAAWPAASRRRARATACCGSHLAERHLRLAGAIGAGEAVAEGLERAVLSSSALAPPGRIGLFLS